MKNFTLKNELIEYAKEVGLYEDLINGNCRVLTRRINYYIENNGLDFPKCTYKGWDGR